MKTGNKIGHGVIVTRFTQATLCLLCLSLALTNYPEREQMLKYLIYFSFLLFNLAVYYNVFEDTKILRQNLNRIFLLLWLNLYLLIRHLESFLNTIERHGKVSYNDYEPWLSFSIDYYPNIIVFAMLIFFTSLYLLSKYQMLRVHKLFIINTLGLNIAMFGTMYLYRQFIHFIEHLF